MIDFRPIRRSVWPAKSAIPTFAASFWRWPANTAAMPSGWKPGRARLFEALPGTCAARRQEPRDWHYENQFIDCMAASGFYACAERSHGEAFTGIGGAGRARDGSSGTFAVQTRDFKNKNTPRHESC